MAKAIDLGGRPTKYGDEIVTKLENIFKVGGTIEEATSYAGISKPTYYRWLEDKSGFITKMEAAQHYADVVAKNLVVESITRDKNIENAKWWLEKRQFRYEDKGTTVNIQANIKSVDPGEMEEFIKFREQKRKKELKSEK